MVFWVKVYWKKQPRIEVMGRVTQIKGIYSEELFFQLWSVFPGVESQKTHYNAIGEDKSQRTRALQHIRQALGEEQRDDDGWVAELKCQGKVCLRLTLDADKKLWFEIPLDAQPYVWVHYPTLLSLRLERGKRVRRGSPSLRQYSIQLRPR